MLQDRLARLHWTTDTSFTLEDVPFALREWDGSGDEPGYRIMKPRPHLEAYGVLNGLEVRNVMELGIHLGGSAIFLATLFRPEKLVTLDIREPIPVFERFRAKHPGASAIAPYFRTSQDDETALAAILGREFEGPLDLVIDDASHDYHLTRSSFEILFPRLRPRGCYVIEDWQWAHQAGFPFWKDKPALSNLIYQLLMVSAGRPGLIAQVQVFPGVAFVWKGDSPAETGRLDIESMCCMQGRTFHLL